MPNVIRSTPSMLVVINLGPVGDQGIGSQPAQFEGFYRTSVKSRQLTSVVQCQNESSASFNGGVSRSKGLSVNVFPLHPYTAFTEVNRHSLRDSIELA